VFCSGQGGTPVKNFAFFATKTHISKIQLGKTNIIFIGLFGIRKKYVNVERVLKKTVLTAK
jgi:hypothetical protein